MYLARDIPPFVMYCVYGESGSSLLIESVIESTDSMISQQGWVELTSEGLLGVHLQCMYCIERSVCCVYMKTLRSINRKKGKATNPNNSFFSEKKKRAARVGFEPTTHCLLGRCSNH